jgi:hypothetical protein
MSDQVLPFTRASDLPVFDNPPVTDATLGIQFESLGVRAVDLGLLQHQLMDRYPLVEERPPAPIQIEVFSQRPRALVEFQILDRPPLPMVVFLSEDRSRLVQVQNDRLACAWRRTETAPYPKYKDLRSEFVRVAELFNDFLKGLGLDHIGVTQAEILFANEILLRGEPRPDALFHALPAFAREGDGEPVISAVTICQQFTISNREGVPYARLHANAEPMTIDSEPSLKISFLYRGEPYERDAAEPGLGSLMRFMDEGHDQIVRAFAANTTEAAHRLWRKRQ